MFIFRRPIGAVFAGLATALIGLLLDQGFSVAAAISQASDAM